MVFKEIEEPFEKIGVVLSQKITSHRLGRFLSDDAGENDAAEAGANVEDFSHIGQLCLRQRGELATIGLRAFFPALPGEVGSFGFRNWRQLDRKPKSLLFEKCLTLQLRVAPAIAHTENGVFSILDDTDEIPKFAVLDSDTGQHLVWRIPAVLSAFVDEKKRAWLL